MRIIAAAVFGVLMTISHPVMGSNPCLVFSEVYFDQSRGERNWVEIYNPTDSTLSLDAFRTSHVRTINVLRSAIAVEPKQSIILCARRKAYEAGWGKRENVYVVESVGWLSTSGFVSMRTRGMNRDTTFSNILWYGEETEFSKKDGRYKIIVPFSKDGVSWRIVVKVLDDSTPYYDYERGASRDGGK